ncbi:adaptin ear-binding coat-associated protein 1 NECAP-1 [Mycena rosella]|uniref:Adaptin ear-binding coat-associated protein 1 NECAP-1 n=1 Tax=Mycena rosella TaxID=1033263 RepID=A0AAD7GEN1_MYCRO|nr:adaptin ear-binding coat-associated protein 1 NECAP-1 [Mycena rosella]
MDDEIESILYIGREVSVFKIPPLKKNEGHRAGEWGDLSAPLWKGRLRIVEKSSGAALLFEDGSTGELFAKADYDTARPCVEAVLDSSRYFVVRVEDAGKKAYLGMGFQERSDSFDFNVALQDYTKRQKAALNPVTASDEPSPHIPAGPKKDYSLKEGQTFSISIPGRPNKATTSSVLPTTNLLGDLSSLSSDTASSASTTSGGGFPLLPPPPSSNRRRS